MALLPVSTIQLEISRAPPAVQRVRAKAFRNALRDVISTDTAVYALFNPRKSECKVRYGGPARSCSLHGFDLEGVPGKHRSSTSIASSRSSLCGPRRHSSRQRIRYSSRAVRQITARAANHKIPAIYDLRTYIDAGGLMSYAPDYLEGFRQAGVYNGRILKGEKPADLPIFRPTKFQFVINLKIAKALRHLDPVFAAVARRRGH